MQQAFKIYTFLLIFSLSINILHSQVGNNDTIRLNINEKINSDSLQKNERLEDIVDYKAQKITSDTPNKVTYLVKDAEVFYQDVSITADYIAIYWENNEVFAHSRTDSLGRIVKRASFTQMGKTYEYESFKYNFKTAQGVVYNARTIEQESVIDAQITKRINDSIFFLRKAIVTTDEYFKNNQDTLADYHINLSKAKFINDNSLIAGPSQLFIEQVPTPLVLPFIYIPLKGKRSAGLILPSFGERESLGFFLQGLGFYTPIGDNFDFEVTADIYTKGSVGIHGLSRYVKNYKYSGSFRLDYEKRIEGTKGLDDFNQSSFYNIAWQHTQDRKANPNLIFRSSVGFRSTQYFRNSVGNEFINNGSVLNNTSSSSISLDKYFETLPITLSINASYNQNFNTDAANLTLPQITASLKRQYPFRNKKGKNIDLLKGLNFDYRFNALNQINATTNKVFSSEAFREGNSGARHQIGLGTGTTLFNYFPLSFNAGYNEVWQFKTLEKEYISTTNKVENTNINGFASFRTFNISAGVSTTLYGQANFKKGALVEAIRHTITPQISYVISPDFSSDSFGYYKSYVDGMGEEVRYSRFEGGVFGSPGTGTTNSVGFSLNNNLEMKVRSKTDSTDIKKIKIFDYLNIASTYNFAADSLNLSDITINGATSLINNKLRLNFSALINPYKIVFDSVQATQGHLINELGSFNISRYNISLNFGLDNSFFGKKKEYASIYKKKGKIRYEEYYFDEENYARFAIPWRLDLGLIYNHSKGFSRIPTNTASVSIRGSISPSPYWSIEGSSNYDFITQKLAYTQFKIARDLRSFNINFGWVPFGAYRNWDFFIGIKANILRDALKYEDRDYSRFNTF